MSATQTDITPGLKRAGRRFGYGVAVVINVAMLIVVQRILDWGWLPFLTEGFAEVVPWISLSLIASIVANSVYQFNDTTPVTSTGRILLNLISILVTSRLLEVFPFDFSRYEFNWGIVARVLLILAIVGAGIGVLVETIKLASGERDAERR